MLNNNNKTYSFPALAALIVLTVIIYLPLNKNGFVRYDDYPYIVDNPNVSSGISFKNIVWAFSSFHQANWHPLTWISHMLDCEVFGLNPKAHHFSALLIHILNTIMVFLLFMVCFENIRQKIFLSFTVALLFSIHPMHVESVAWASERKDLLSAFFGLSSIISYVKYMKFKKTGFYAASVAFYIFALLSKPMAVTIPLLFIILEIWPLKILTGLTGLLRNKILFFALSAASAIVTYTAQNICGAVRDVSEISLWLRLKNIFVSYCLYVIKYFAPVNLSFFYPFQEIPLLKALLCLIIFIMITIFCIKKFRDRPWLAAGWLWFTLMLISVIGIVQAGYQSMADRYTYMPYIGINIIIAFEIHALISRYGRKIYIIFTAWTIFLSIAAYKQTAVWKDSFSLFSHAIRTTENNFMAYNNMGVAYYYMRDFENAEKYFSETLKIMPFHTSALINLSEIYMRTNRHDQSLAALEKVVASGRKNPRILHNIKVLHSLKSKNKPADP